MRVVCRVNGRVHVRAGARGRDHASDCGHANVRDHVNDHGHGREPSHDHVGAFCRLHAHATRPDQTCRAHAGLH